MAEADKRVTKTRTRTVAPAPGRAQSGSPPPAGLPGGGPGLPPTAQRLLEAARRLLARSGYNSLSVEAIGREAGENKALIRYYFGSKNGLIVALVDWLVADTLWQSRQRLSRQSAEQTPSERVIETSEALLDDAASYRLLFDLLPRLLENPAMARQFADLYFAYREQNTQALWSANKGNPPAVVRNLAAMTVALTDGLAIQILADPASVDVRAFLAMWQSFVDGVLATVPAAAPPS